MEFVYEESEKKKYILHISEQFCQNKKKKKEKSRRWGRGEGGNQKRKS